MNYRPSPFSCDPRAKDPSNNYDTHSFYCICYECQVLTSQILALLLPDCSIAQLQLVVSLFIFHPIGGGEGKKVGRVWEDLRIRSQSFLIIWEYMGVWKRGWKWEGGDCTSMNWIGPTFMSCDWNKLWIRYGLTNAIGSLLGEVLDEG